MIGEIIHAVGLYDQHKRKPMTNPQVRIFSVYYVHFQHLGNRCLATCMDGPKTVEHGFWIDAKQEPTPYYRVLTDTNPDANTWIPPNRLRFVEKVTATAEQHQTLRGERV